MPEEVVEAAVGEAAAAEAAGEALAAVPDPVPETTLP